MSPLAFAIGFKIMATIFAAAWGVYAFAGLDTWADKHVQSADHRGHFYLGAYALFGITGLAILVGIWVPFR